MGNTPQEKERRQKLLLAIMLVCVDGKPLRKASTETGLKLTTLWRLVKGLRESPRTKLKECLLAAIKPLPRGGRRASRRNIIPDDRRLVQKLNKQISLQWGYKGPYAKYVVDWLEERGYRLSEAGLHSYIYRNSKKRGGHPHLRRRPKYLRSARFSGHPG